MIIIDSILMIWQEVVKVAGRVKSSEWRARES
jgi:hypothetical protein